MNVVILAATATMTMTPAPRTLAALRVATESGAIMDVRVQRKDASGQTEITVDCVEDCRRPVHFSQEIDDNPMGLFQRCDCDDLVYSVWSGGSAYRVRVWSVNGDGVKLVFERSTRGWPDFQTDRSGRQVIRTWERSEDAEGRENSLKLKPVLWRLDHGRFLRESG